MRVQIKYLESKENKKAIHTVGIDISFLGKMQQGHLHVQEKGCSKGAAFGDHIVKSSEKKLCQLEL